MLDELKAFDLELKGELPEHINPDDLFVAVGDLDILASLNLYKVNQREGKYNVLKKFFELSERELGESEFRRIAVSFISRYPSPNYTLSSYHPEFAGFLAVNAGEKEPLVRDLARFEWRWHRLGRVDFEQARPDIKEHLATLDPAAAKFQISESAFVERFEHRIHEVFRQLKGGEEAEIKPGKNFVLFYRSQPTVKNRKVLTLWQAHLIKLMKKHVSLSLAVANITRHSEVAPGEVIHFIDELIRDNVIVNVR